VALKDRGIQVILTSHSTNITSQAKFATLVSLTRREDATISSRKLADNDELSADDISDLERYLDATKSNLLFARKVMLVEGPAELFLIPALVEAVHHINLERSGISVISIYGVHFDVYAKLFRKGSLEKRCAIVADADLVPSDAGDEFDIDESAPDLASLRGEFIEVFAGATTFERELVLPGTLEMLIETARTLGAPRIAAQLEQGRVRLDDPFIDDDEERALLTQLGGLVLSTAKRFGKARFAQVAARHAHLCTELPTYVEQALEWLRE
jgi:putative ATP-dependent endonuclease of the OLD family